MSNEIQNDDMYLQGDLGTVRIGSANHEITKIFKANDGTTTLTIDPFPRSIEITIGKGWEVVQPKQITNQKPTNQ